MLPISLPLPLVDHVVVSLRDQLDAGAATYRRLGFSLTPRGYHTLGSMNHLAVFGTDYLELLAAPAGSARREIADAPIGLGALVFATRDADATHAAVTASGVPVLAPQAFSRPVEIDGVPRAAAFRTVRLPVDTAPAGRFYFCEHATPELVWRDAWRAHPNAVTGIARVVIAAADPGALGALFARMFGDAMVYGEADGYVLTLGLATCEIRTPAVVRAGYGNLAAGRGDFMAALVLRSASLERTAAALAAGGVAVMRVGGRILVPAEAACGVTLVFEA